MSTMVSLHIRMAGRGTYSLCPVSVVLLWKQVKNQKPGHLWNLVPSYDHLSYDNIPEHPDDLTSRFDDKTVCRSCTLF